MTRHTMASALALSLVACTELLGNDFHVVDPPQEGESDTPGQDGATAPPDPTADGDASSDEAAADPQPSADSAPVDGASNGGDDAYRVDDAASSKGGSGGTQEANPPDATDGTSTPDRKDSGGNPGHDASGGAAGSTEAGTGS